MCKMPGRQRWIVSRYELKEWNVYGSGTDDNIRHFRHPWLATNMPSFRWMHLWWSPHTQTHTSMQRQYDHCSYIFTSQISHPIQQHLANSQENKCKWDSITKTEVRNTSHLNGASKHVGVKTLYTTLAPKNPHILLRSLISTLISQIHKFDWLQNNSIFNSAWAQTM